MPSQFGGIPVDQSAPVSKFGGVPVKAPVKAPDATFQPVKDYIDYEKQAIPADIKQITDPAPVMSPDTSGAYQGRLGNPAAMKPVGKGPATEVPPLTQASRFGGVAAIPFDLTKGGVGHAVVSKPLERATGVPSEYTDLAIAFGPAAVGAAAGVAGKAAKAAGITKLPAPLAKGAEVIKGILSPSTMSKESEATSGILREERGLAERGTEQARVQVDKFAQDVNALPPAEQLDFINYVETRSKGGKLANPQLQGAADTLRDVYQDMKTKLENFPDTEKMGFVKDYFPHMWQDPKKAQAFYQQFTSKTGSGKYTNKRNIPTVADGIKAGLVPVESNPLSATMRYVGDMHNFMATKAAQRAMSKQGLREFAFPGKQKPGWVELKGPGNEIKFVMKDKNGSPTAAIKKAYAPEDAAYVYNNNYSPGFTGKAGSVYEGLRRAVNGTTRMVLGLSGYHIKTILQESTANAFARAMGKFSNKQFKEGGQAALKGVSKYVSAGMDLAKGERAVKQYLGTDVGLKKEVDLLTRGGARFVGTDKAMKGSPMGSFWEAWKRGTLKHELQSDLKHITSASGYGQGMARAGAAAVRNMGRIMDTTAYPLFTKAIPTIKAGVNVEAMRDWLKLHPAASEAESMKAARDIVDSTDNRFGELIQDNIFWNKKLKQATQLMVVSAGWDIGTLREIGGGATDIARSIAKGDEMSRRAQYVMALPITHMLQASVYQYLKTGSLPNQPQDLIYPKTGGTTTYGQGTKYEKTVPERANMPGYEKDVQGYFKHPLQEISNKVAPFWKLVSEMATNSDWKGDPIAYTQSTSPPVWATAYAKHVLNAYMPLGVQGLATSAPRGSNITGSERFMGERPAGMEATDPQAFKDMMAAKEAAREKTGKKHQEAEKRKALQ